MPGIQLGTASAGLRPSGRPDTVVIDAGALVPAAGVFTSNRACAAPVQVSREHLASGHARAVVANAGCANACTGERGMAAARMMAAEAASLVGCDPSDVLVASTGLIGTFLDEDGMAKAIEGCELAGGEEAGQRAARAIMTTDTVAKHCAAEIDIAQGRRAIVGAIAKGAAMLAPSMATMLAFAATDAVATPAALQAALATAVSRTFNRISVDACQSTNDTVLLLATGAAGGDAIDSPAHPGFAPLEAGLSCVLGEIAHAMVADGEGSTRVARVRVTGAASADDAELAVRAICSSVLVRCSLYGADAYWGRLVSEIGASGAQLNMSTISVAYGDHVVAEAGVESGHDAAALGAYMAGPEIAISCDLGLGAGEAEMLTCDLGPGYIEENRKTS